MSSATPRHKRPWSTIGFRLTLWGAGITMGIGLLLCGILYAGMSFSLRHEVDGFLEGELDELTAVLREHGRDYRAAEKSIRLELGHRVRADLSFRLLDADGRVLVKSDPNDQLREVPVPPPEWLANPLGTLFETVEIPTTLYPVRICSRGFRDEKGVTHIAQTGYLLDRVTASLAAFRRICTGALIFVAIAAVLGGRVIANRSLRPIQAMIAKAGQIGAQKLNDRLPRSGAADELDRLAGTLNEMLDRIEGHVGRLRQFTADASHEFRSPLAALRGNAEVALSRERTAAELRGVIEESIEHYDRLARVAEDLLLLARADAGRLLLRRERLRLDQAVADVVDLYAPLAKDQQIELLFGHREQIWLQADGSRLRQLVGNVVDNAIRYIGTGKKVVVSLASVNGTARIRVTDDGPGISAEHLERIFDRFYRVDRSRSGHGPGGAGLGLSICRSIAEAHGGNMDAASAPGEGTSVTICLPLHCNT